MDIAPQKRAIEIRVRGSVQGVFFRVSAQKEARRFALTGWVTNMPDGSVQIYACGEESALQALIAWCKSGPPDAKVHEVHTEEAACEAFTDFEIR